MGRVIHSAPISATGTHAGARAARRGTPNAPMTAATWNSDAEAPELAKLNPRVSASNAGSHAVTE